MRYSGYDIIGDVHGCACTLEKLLSKLEYQQEDGVYYHPSRQAVFVGDLIDRGPKIRECLQIVKAMVEAGSALCVMGNHEYNAIAYNTPAPPGMEQEFVRHHSNHNTDQLAATASQFSRHPQEWQVYLDWFQTLPIFLDLPEFRVVHACWDQTLINTFRERGNDTNTVSKDFVVASADKTSFEWRFLDRITRGTNMYLPKKRRITGQDGIKRSVFRTKFWNNNPQTYRDIVFQPDPLPDDILDIPLSDEQKASLLTYSETEVPIFIGHYWLKGNPKPLQSNIACLDYSAVKFGRLVAYRFDGEARLNESKFEWVYVEPELKQSANAS